MKHEQNKLIAVETSEMSCDYEIRGRDVLIAFLGKNKGVPKGATRRFFPLFIKHLTLPEGPSSFSFDRISMEDILSEPLEHLVEKDGWTRGSLDPKKLLHSRALDPSWHMTWPQFLEKYAQKRT